MKYIGLYNIYGKCLIFSIKCYKMHMQKETYVIKFKLYKNGKEARESYPLPNFKGGIKNGKSKI